MLMVCVPIEPTVIRDINTKADISTNACTRKTTQKSNTRKTEVKLFITKLKPLGD